MKLFKKKKKSFKKQWNKSDNCKFNLIIHDHKLLVGKRNKSITQLTPIEIATAARRLLPKINPKIRGVSTTPNYGNGWQLLWLVLL